jgi:hypothetical protein
MDKTQIYKIIKRIWRFLVYDDSWASFAADAVLILLIGKFILFPGLGMIFGTAFPVVAVVSGSMDHHDMEFQDWWEANKDQYEQYNITQSDFEEYYLKNGFNKGDVLVIQGQPISELSAGDIIVYSVPQRSDPIIHRIVGTSEEYISTKGDANPGQIGFEKTIPSERIHGKAILLLPYLGWIKVGFLQLFGLL